MERLRYSASVRMRGRFPLASRDDIMALVDKHGDMAYKAIEEYLDAEPKKSISEDLAEELKWDRHVKVHSFYVLPNED